MDKKYYVYEWFNVVTGEVFYVGKGIRNRYCQLSGRNQYFIDYFNTHECESRIVYENLTEQEAYEKEKELIKYYRETSNFRLTNVTDGGEGNPFKSGELNPKFGKGEEIKGEKNPFYGQKHTKRIKKILSQKATLRVGELNPFFGKQHSEKTKKIISDKAKIRLSIKENNGMYGRNHSEEVKRKLSEHHKGKTIPLEVRRKISNTIKEKYKDTPHFNLGRKHSEETRKLLSLTRKGEKNPNWRNGDKIKGERNPMYGKKHSEEARRKMSERAKNRSFDCKCKKCKRNFKGRAWNSATCDRCK